MLDSQAAMVRFLNLIAAEKGAANPSPKDAEILLKTIAVELGIDAGLVDEAYEDPGEWVLKESRLPDNLDPSNSKRKNAAAWRACSSVA